MSFLSNLKWRYATKKFDASKIVSREDLTKILEAIRFAPSSYGIQPFHVTVISNKELQKEMVKASYGQTQLAEASYVLVFSCRTDIRKRGAEYMSLIADKYPEYAKQMKTYLFLNWLKQLLTFNIKGWSTAQAMIALGFAMSALAELQIDSCPMEGFIAGKIKKMLALPNNLCPVVLLPIGYRDSEDKVREKVRFENEDLFDFRL